MPEFLEEVELVYDEEEQRDWMDEKWHEQDRRNVEGFKLRLIAKPRPPERGNLPVVDLFARLKRRQQMTPPLEERRRKREMWDEAQRFREKRDEILLQKEMARRAEICGIDHEVGVNDFVSTDDWFMDIMVDTLNK